MIGNITKGSGVEACLSYVLGKENAQRLGGNVRGETPKQVAELYHQFGLRNPRVERLICHISLSVKADEEIKPWTWLAIAEDYLQLMNFGVVPYLVVQHHDTDHNHIHIVAGRVRADGTCVSDQWDYYRNQQTVRWLEEKYGLSPNPTRSLEPYQPSPQEETAYTYIQETIPQIHPQVATLDDFLRFLEEQRISASLVTSREKYLIKGIRYEYDGHSFTGTQLGAAYTWKQVNLGFNSLKAIPSRYLSEPVASPSKISESELEANPQVQLLRLQAIAPIADEILSRFKVRQFVGKLYKLHRFGASELLVTRIKDNALVCRAYKDPEQDWKAISCQIRLEDYNCFQQVAQQIQQPLQPQVNVGKVPPKSRGGRS